MSQVDEDTKIKRLIQLEDQIEDDKRKLELLKKIKHDRARKNLN